MKSHEQPLSTDLVGETVTVSERGEGGSMWPVARGRVRAAAITAHDGCLILWLQLDPDAPQYMRHHQSPITPGDVVRLVCDNEYGAATIRIHAQEPAL